MSELINCSKLALFISKLTYCPPSSPPFLFMFPCFLFLFICFIMSLVKKHISLIIQPRFQFSFPTKLLFHLNLKFMGQSYWWELKNNWAAMGSIKPNQVFSNHICLLKFETIKRNWKWRSTEAFSGSWKTCIVFCCSCCCCYQQQL